MKKILLATLLCFSLPAVADIDKKVDTAENRSILKKVETAYNKIKTLKAEFAQFNSKTENDLYQKELEEFDSMDINGDGKLSKNELYVAQIAFGKSVDKNNDGFISKEEYKKC